MKQLIISITLGLFASLTCSAQSEVKIEFFEQNRFRLSPQEDPVACWAASMSAALQCKGVDLSQASIKWALKGHPYAATLKDPMELATLTGFLSELPYREGRLNAVVVTPPGQWISWDDLADEFQNGNPMVVAYWTGPMRAHVVVVYGFIVNSFGQPVAYKLWDPMPGVGLQVVPVVALNQHAWFYVLVRDASLEGN